MEVLLTSLTPARSTIVVALFLLGMSNALAQSASGAAAANPVQPILNWQKAAGGHMEFEVASIRPAAPGASWHGNLDLSIEDLMRPTGGRFSTTATLGGYIQFAYKLMQGASQDQTDYTNVPKWVSTEFFDIEAKAAAANPTKDQVRLMMQTLLADRFKLAAHFETRDRPVMALVLLKPGKLGPHLRPHSQGPPCDAKIPPVDLSSPKIPDVWIPVCGTTQNHDWKNNTVILGSRDTTLDVLADFISLIEPLGRPVVDQTGLTGRFDLELNFTPPWKMPKEQSTDAQLDLTGPTLLEALKDQLGLKLISTHALVQTLVIDHTEQPSPN